MYTMYIPELGEVNVRVNDLHKIGNKTYLLGYDATHTRVRFTVDKIRVPKDQPNDCGFCHITSYTKGDKVTQCNIYKALH